MGDIDDSLRNPSMERVASQCEDQAAMTIEFLRARLLSERAVSKAARQRAQQLAKKVSELEQRVESEIHKRLDEARLELLSKHKGELMEDYGHLFIDGFDKGSHDGDEHPTQQASLAQRECKSDDAEGFSTAGEVNDFEGNASNQGGQHDDGDGEEDDMDRVAREKGILAWASRRSNRKLQIKEWTRFNRSFSPTSFSTLSPDRDSPRKRWVGKSVRQIRTRTISMDVEGDGEVKQDHAKDGLLQSDEERDEEVQRILEHQSELIEQFKVEENAQRAWEKKFWEQNRPKDDISKDEDSFLDARGEEEGEVLITSDERDIKERAESTHGIVKLAEKVHDASKQHAEDETLESLHSNVTGLKTVLSTAVIHEGCNISEGELVVGADNMVSEDRPSGGGDNEECKNTASKYSPDMPHENGLHDILHDSSEGRTVVTTTDYISYAPTNALDLISPKLTADPLQEGVHNESDLRRHVYNGGAHVSSGSKFYASSVSSSQGSIAALDSASYQRQDMFSAYANNQERFEAMSRDSSERPFKNRDYIRDGFIRSPSTASDNDKPFKKDNYENKARGSTFGSPGNGNSSHGSSKGLMNSSWEEIFQRRIKAQEAMKAENDLNNGLLHPLSFIEKQQLYAQTFNTSTRTPPHTYTDSPYMYGAYKERRYPRIHHNSMDAGLERVTEVLRALQIAKHHVQSSDEFGYSHQFVPDASGSYFSPLPAREMEPFMYDIEDGRMAAGAGYVRSPSRQPISMQHAWIRGEPIAGQYAWSHHRNHANPPPYAGQHSR